MFKLSKPRKLGDNLLKKKAQEEKPKRKLKEGDPHTKKISIKQRFIAEVICLMSPNLYTYLEDIKYNPNSFYKFIGHYKDKYEEQSEIVTIDVEWLEDNYTELLEIYNTDFYEDVKNHKELVARIKLTKEPTVPNRINEDDRILNYQIQYSIYDIRQNLDLGFDNICKYQCMADIITVVNIELRKEWDNLNQDDYETVVKFVNKYIHLYNKIKLNVISESADVYGINPWNDPDETCSATLILDKFEDTLYGYELQTDDMLVIDRGELR